MRVSSGLLLGACLAGVTAVPAPAQGVLAKARYASPVIAGTVAGLPGQALPLPTATAPAVPAAAHGAADVSVSIGADGTVTFSPGAVGSVDGGAVCVMPAHPGDLPAGVPGGDGPPLTNMPLLPAPDGFAPPDGLLPDVAVTAVDAAVAAAVAPQGGQQVIAVTGTPTPAALLRAANAANAAAGQAGGEASGLAAQIRAQARAAAGTFRNRASGGKTIGLGVAAFGTPADARPLGAAPRAPGAPAPASGPAAGLPRVHLPHSGAAPAGPTPPPNTTTVAATTAAGAQAAATAAPAARAGVAAALGGTARVVAPAGAAAPRWRDRFSFASPLGR